MFEKQEDNMENPTQQHHRKMYVKDRKRKYKKKVVWFDSLYKQKLGKIFLNLTVPYILNTNFTKYSRATKIYRMNDKNNEKLNSKQIGNCRDKNIRPLKGNCRKTNISSEVDKKKKKKEKGKRKNENQ